MIESLVEHWQTRDQARHGGGRLLGARLGEIVQAILVAVPLRRLLLSGGDTSSQVTRVLAPDALEIEARLSPGTPLCRVISEKPQLRAPQIALREARWGMLHFLSGPCEERLKPDSTHTGETRWTRINAFRSLRVEPWVSGPPSASSSPNPDSLWSSRTSI